MIAPTYSVGDTDAMARREPDEYQQRMIDDAVATSTWVRWPLRKRLLWATVTAVLGLAGLAGLALLLGSADGAYMAAGVGSAVIAAFLLVTLTVAAFVPAAWIRGLVWTSTPRIEDLSSSRGFAMPQIVVPQESDADTERRLARRANELVESQKRLARQLRHQDGGERDDDNPATDEPK
jgi:hypothetical protein